MAAPRPSCFKYSGVPSLEALSTATICEGSTPEFIRLSTHFLVWSRQLSVANVMV